MSFSSFFLSTFFLVLGQTTNQNSFFSYHILTNILSVNYNCFVIKKSLNNIPFRKLSLNWKERSKKNKKITCKVLPNLCTARIQQNYVTLKVFRSSRLWLVKCNKTIRNKKLFLRKKYVWFFYKNFIFLSKNLFFSNKINICIPLLKNLIIFKKFFSI